MCDVEMLYDQRRTHILGKAALQQHMQGEHMSMNSSRDGVDKAFAFWYSLEGGSRLPDVIHAGLESATFHFSVTLLCYDPQLAAPPAVNLVDASSFLPRADFDQLLARGARLPHLADAVRMIAVSKHNGAAWFIDGKTLWLKRFPLDAVSVVQNHGHVFASLLASPNAIKGTAEQRDYYWRVHFLKQPGDRLYLATPCRFPFGSPVVSDLVNWCRRNILSSLDCASLECNAFMRVLRQTVQTWGLEGAIWDPIYFSPVLYSSGSLCLQRLEHGQWDLSQIMEKSFAVNSLWQTSHSTSAGAAVERGSLSSVSEKSLWAKLMKASGCSSSFCGKRATRW